MNILRLDCVDSTNREIKRRVLAGGAPPGLVVIAREQTAGKGRLGRNWLSQRDMGLYMSLLLRPVMPIGTLPLAAGLAVCEALEAALPVTPVVKWPNDLLLNGKKICGILAEASWSESRPFTVLGVGINLYQRQFPPELAGKATSLALESPVAVDRILLEEAVLAGLERVIHIWEREGFAPFHAKYRHKCCTLGRMVWLQGLETRQALALDVTADGRLLVRLPDGATERVAAGEVSLQDSYAGDQS